MENDFKIFLIFSFLVHAGLFGAFSLQKKHSIYIVLPIDLLLNSPSQGEIAKNTPPQQPAKEIIKEKIKEKDIVIPKKKPKAEPVPKKEIIKQQEEKKPQPVPSQPVPVQPQTQAQTAAPSGYSGAISVDTARFPYAYYTNQIVRKINRYWQWSNEFGKLKTVVFFKISRDGIISGETVKDSSGDNLFDAQALRAVTMASPFPPLPDGYPDNDLGVYFEFTFKE